MYIMNKTCILLNISSLLRSLMILIHIIVTRTSDIFFQLALFISALAEWQYIRINLRLTASSGLTFLVTDQFFFQLISHSSTQ